MIEPCKEASDVDIMTFEKMHVCPNVIPGGGCPRCSMYWRMKRAERERDELAAWARQAEKDVAEARKTFELYTKHFNAIWRVAGLKSGAA